MLHDIPNFSIWCLQSFTLQQLEQEKGALLDELNRLPGGYDEDDLAAASTRSGPAHSSGPAASTASSTSAGSIAAAMQRLREVQQRRQELTAALTRNYSSWRVITQMRAHWLSSNCTPAQLAIGILQAFPYMPHGAPVLDPIKKLADRQQQQKQGRQQEQAAAQRLQYQLQLQNLDSTPSAMSAEVTGATGSQHV
jgi:hypothetical protein